METDEDHLRTSEMIDNLCAIGGKCVRKRCWILLAGALLMLSGCTAASEAAVGREGTPQAAETTETDIHQTDETGRNAAKVDDNKVLIAYFTWADNTVVNNPESVDVDATTSASVLAPGNTALLAGWIQEAVGGDLFSIQVEEPYSSDYDACLERANGEKAAKARPGLSSHVENMEDYDTIILGFPNWWYTCPMAVFSFIEEYDLSGKNIIPFCTHGTAGLATTIRDLTAELPDSTILEPIGIYREDVAESRDTIQDWIKGQIN